MVYMIDPPSQRYSIDLAIMRRTLLHEIERHDTMNENGITRNSTQHRIWNMAKGISCIAPLVHIYWITLVWEHLLNGRMVLSTYVCVCALVFIQLSLKMMMKTSRRCCSSRKLCGDASRNEEEHISCFYSQASFYSRTDSNTYICSSPSDARTASH